MQLKNKKNLVIIVIIVLLLVVACGIVAYFSTPLSPEAVALAEPVPLPSAKPLTEKSLAESGRMKPIGKVLPSDQASPDAPALTESSTQPVTAGNVKTESELQARLRILKLQSQIDELEAKSAAAKVKEAKQGNASSIPALPDLSALTPPAQRVSNPPQFLSTPKRSNSVAVVSVQGIGDSISASIRTNAGAIVTVRPGSKFGGGIVDSISRQAVTIRTGKQITALPFEQ